MKPTYDGLGHRIKTLLGLCPKPRTVEFNSNSWTRDRVERVRAEAREGQWVDRGTIRVPNPDADEQLARYERWRRGYGNDNE